MKIRILQMTIAAAALVMAVQTRASLEVFDISYSDPSGDVLSGQLTAISLGGNQYLATSGTITVAATDQDAGAFVGTYSLLPGGPGNVLSPSGSFQYDNVLYYPGSPNIVDFSGILGFVGSGGIELNLFGDQNNTPGYYSLEGYSSGTGLVDFYVLNQGNVAGPATATLTPVPEATTMIAGALLLLPLGASTLRILRKSRMA
jgi:hypothetical protein